MKNLFDLTLNLEDADHNDISNVIGCLLNEDVQEIELFGCTIKFVNLKDIPGGFYSNSTRRLTCLDSHKDVLLDVNLQGRMLKSFKENIKQQIKWIK